MKTTFLYILYNAFILNIDFMLLLYVVFIDFLDA